MKHRSEMGGCLCFSCRTLVILTGCFSVISSLITILMTIYLVINTEAYYWISDQIRTWLQMHQGDKEVRCILSCQFFFTSSNDAHLIFAGAGHDSVLP